MARDLDQARAAQAWKDVQKRKDADYKNAAKAAPSMIMNNGLMQTLAFLHQKGGSQELLSSQISTWILRQIFAEQSGQANEAPFKNVLDRLHKTNSLTYRRATEEALSYLRWVRQFAAALIRD